MLTIKDLESQLQNLVQQRTMFQRSYQETCGAINFVSQQIAQIRKKEADDEAKRKAEEEAKQKAAATPAQECPPDKTGEAKAELNTSQSEPPKAKADNLKSLPANDGPESKVKH